MSDARICVCLLVSPRGAGRILASRFLLFVALVMSWANQLLAVATRWTDSVIAALIKHLERKRVSAFPKRSAIPLILRIYWHEKTDVCKIPPYNWIILGLQRVINVLIVFLKEVINY